MRNKIFREEFSYFLDKFKSKNNFNLLRFSDGEMFILQNKEIILKSETIKVQDVVESKDGWYSDNNIPRPDYDQKHFHPIKHSLFRDSLVNSFLYNSSNFSNYQKYIDEVKSFISENNVNNEVFLFSASSLSNVMQYELHKSFPNNTYIDIGTTLSHEFGIPVLRGYIHDTFNNNLNNLQTCTWN